MPANIQRDGAFSPGRHFWHPGGGRSVDFCFRALPQPTAPDSLATMVDKKYLPAWLADRAYYKLQLGSAADNPDQRIAEDLHQFTGYILDSIARADFIGRFPIFISQHPLGTFWCSRHSLGVLGTAHIPGYLVWAAVDLRRAGHLAGGHHRFAHWAALNSARQRYEADFRFSLVHLREHAESVACMVVNRSTSASSTSVCETCLQTTAANMHR